MQHASLVAPAHRRRDVGADDLRHPVVGDDAPPLYAIEKCHGVRDSGFGNRVRLELVALDEIGGLAGFYLVSRTPAAGHCTSVDQRSPPGHALSRILTPTTNPSRTGMIVATRRGSWAAS